MCKEGFTGDPDSTEGCYENGLESISSPGCLVNNETYSVGQKWNDGCAYTCTCSEKLEILCQVNKNNFNFILVKSPLCWIIIDFFASFHFNDLSENSQNCLDFIFKSCACCLKISKNVSFEFRSKIKLARKFKYIFFACNVAKMRPFLVNFKHCFVVKNNFICSFTKLYLKLFLETFC